MTCPKKTRSGSVVFCNSTYEGYRRCISFSSALGLKLERERIYLIPNLNAGRVRGFRCLWLGVFFLVLYAR
jgi:hypothetical protein